jgi:hypothetical protein
MAVHMRSEGVPQVPLTLYNDRVREESNITVTPSLASLLACADVWAREERRNDAATLTFSSTLAAMMIGGDPLCDWLRLQVALRGASPELVTKGRTFRNLSIPTTRLGTTHSFRRALEQAMAIAGPEATLDVRHLMAAYPVVKDYHAADFIRFRIDRRAWCLALSDYLQRTEPAEAALWRSYAHLAPEVLLPDYRPDVPRGTDLLGIGREVEAFSMLIASAQTAMPLSIGVFGAWGSGKSFFMARVEERVAALAECGKTDRTYLQRIAQVRFNAWHYSEGDVVASLVDHIFRNLRFGPNESEVVLSKRRLDALEQVAKADRDRDALQQATSAATAEESQLRAKLEETLAQNEAIVQKANDDLAAAQTAVGNAEKVLQGEVTRQHNLIAAAQMRAPAAQVADVMTNVIFADEKLAKLRDDIDRVRQDARWLGANRVTIGWGLLVVLMTVLAAAAVPAVRDSAFLTTAVAVLAAVGPFAKKLMDAFRELAQKGAAFEAAVQNRLHAEVARIQQEGAEALQQRQAALDAANSIVESLRSEIAVAVESTRQAQATLAAAVQRRKETSQQLIDAAGASAIARSRLKTLTVGSLLGETIQQASDTDAFRSQLGTLSYARNYFQRLSETMGAARREVEAGGASPVLERVVLYIDDLDRCGPEQVQRVLQAVHLLLAFDLFACVIAVDPRWIIECLEGSPGVNTLGDRSDELRMLGGRTTPSDYLEKIIQIPLWLRPIPSDRRAALATILMQKDAASRPAAPGHDGPGGGAPASTLGGGLHSAPRHDHRVRINPSELDFLRARVALLLDGNSRALKRFVNTYQLVKASLSEVEFDSFANDVDAREHHLPYRVCMAQLALLTTQRTRARLLASVVDETSAVMSSESAKDARQTLGDWLDGLVAKGGECQSIAEDLKHVLLPELGGLPFDRFSGWFERTRRYSFYV